MTETEGSSSKWNNFQNKFLDKLNIERGEKQKDRLTRGESIASNVSLVFICYILISI